MNPDGEMVEVYQSEATPCPRNATPVPGEQQILVPCVSGSGTIIITYELCPVQTTPTLTRMVYSTSIDLARHSLFLSVADA